MKARFELERTAAASPLLDPRYVDPESATPEASDLDPYDASEQYFSITLDKTIDSSTRFIVNEEPADTGEGKKTPDALKEIKSAAKPGADFQAPEKNEFAQVQAAPHTEHESCWRQEVSDRLSKYQSRRRIREPRYPSLRLKFEPLEAWTGSPPGADSVSAPVANSSSLAKSLVLETLGQDAPLKPSPIPPAEPVGRLIEFPRSFSFEGVPKGAEELAEPVFDRPRIMEAPELVPAPPAMQGILIESVEVAANEKRPGFELPLQPAQMGRRLAATAIDSLLAGAAVALFAGVFWKVTGLIPAVRTALPLIVIVAALLWAGYQYLLVVHCGTTPGLRIAKLKLSHFDDSAVLRKTRRWRVISSMLSILSLGLGYAWCFLDEDQLCWHDRITRTYLAPIKKN